MYFGSDMFQKVISHCLYHIYIMYAFLPVNYYPYNLNNWEYLRVQLLSIFMHIFVVLPTVLLVLYFNLIVVYGDSCFLKL